MKIINKNYFIFTILFLFCGFYSVSIGLDSTIELMFYHYWNGYSFLTGRPFQNIDFAFCGVHSYFNPIFDTGLYLITKCLNNFPRLFCFLQGFFPALGLFFLYKTVNLIILGKANKISGILFTLIFASSSLLFFYQLGTCLIDLQLCFLPLSALYLIFKYKNSDTKKQNLAALIAGILLGAAVGFKLTYAGYGVAFFITVCIFARKFNTPFKFIAFWVSGAILGFMAIDGLWALYLYVTYGNPVFPFYNNIFHSEYTTMETYKLMDLLPKNFFQWIAYPFFWFSPDSTKVILMPYNNTSWCFVYIIFITYGNTRFMKKYSNNEDFQKFKEIIVVENLNFLMTFIAFAYAIWLYCFSVLRHAVLIDMFIGFFIFCSIMYLYPSLKKTVYVFLILVIAVQLTHTDSYPKNLKREIQSPIFYSENAYIPDDAVVFSAGFPVSFTAVFQNPKAHYVYGHNDPRIDFQYSDKSADIVNNWINENPNEIYAFFGTYGYIDSSQDYYVYNNYIIDKNSCKIINNNFIINENEFVSLCKVVQKNK